jgi:hypothetical protein
MFSARVAQPATNTAAPIDITRFIDCPPALTCGKPGLAVNRRVLYALIPSF